MSHPKLTYGVLTQYSTLNLLAPCQALATTINTVFNIKHCDHCVYYIYNSKHFVIVYVTVIVEMID